MTLDKAIERAETAAKKQTFLFDICPYPTAECNGREDCRSLQDGKGKGCQKCAAEYRQLAEWLKDYKRLLETRPITYQDCSNAMMMMWMNNVLTDGEYNKIMDKLNEAYKKGKI